MRLFLKLFGFHQRVSPSIFLYILQHKGCRKIPIGPLFTSFGTLTLFKNLNLKIFSNCFQSFVSVWKPITLISGVATKPTVQSFFRSAFRSSSRLLSSSFRHVSLSGFQRSLYLRQYLTANRLIYSSLNLRTFFAHEITHLPGDSLI